MIGENMDEKKLITIGIYFEISDSELYGGEDTVGYACINAEISVDTIDSEKIKHYVESQTKTVAEMCKVAVENVRLIPRTEYEENTEDD